MATDATTKPGDHLPKPPHPAEIKPHDDAILADLRTPLVANQHSLHWITENICSISESKTPLWWWIAFVPCALLAAVCFSCFGYLIFTGVGVWGENVPAAWAWDITNFVFWIGIGHAGTLISAILFLTRQKWRTAVNRAAEAMTLFAVMCAGLYPGLHVGRVWMAWFLAPVPNLYAIWPNFRSPLLWDVFAVSTYFTVSVLFWFTGLIPDLATLRDRARARGNKLAAYAYGFLALGWRGGNRQWRHYEMAYLLLAALSTPLVLSVHTIVSFDFATSVVPGWHTTIFPPYFVAGAIFGGFAMVLTLMLPMRLIYPQLKDMITPRHIDVMAKIILLTGSIVGYAYIMEFFVAWYSGNMYEGFAFIRNRAAGPVTDLLHWVMPSLVPKMPWGPSWYYYYAMMTCNVLSPQIFWFRWCRRNLWVVFIGCQFVNMGMWFERYVIIVTSISRDFLCSCCSSGSCLPSPSRRSRASRPPPTRTPVTVSRRATRVARSPNPPIWSRRKSKATVARNRPPPVPVCPRPVPTGRNLSSPPRPKAAPNNRRRSWPPPFPPCRPPPPASLTRWARSSRLPPRCSTPPRKPATSVSNAGTCIRRFRSTGWMTPWGSASRLSASSCSAAD